MRQASATELARMEFDGYGIGGCFSKRDLNQSLEWVNTILPEAKPRHLLGIGEPEDILLGVKMGCDTFDCVAPTRLARTGTIYERIGDEHQRTNLFNSRYRNDFSKPCADCDCPVCQKYSKAYLAHLFHAKEMLGAHLASIHNL